MSQPSSSMTELKEDEFPNDVPAGHITPDHTPPEIPLQDADQSVDEGPELTLLTSLQVLGGFMCLFNS